MSSPYLPDIKSGHTQPELALLDAAVAFNRALAIAHEQGVMFTVSVSHSMRLGESPTWAGVRIYRETPMPHGKINGWICFRDTQEERYMAEAIAAEKVKGESDAVEG